MIKVASVMLIIVLSFAALFTASYTSGQNTNNMQNLTVTNNLQRFGVEVILSTDRNFNAEATNYIGGYNQVIPLIEGSKPFALFIKNNSLKEIVGISLRWQFVKSNGETHVARQIESTPGILMGIKPRDPWMIGKTSLLNAKSIKFFSIFNIIEQIIENTNKSVKYKRFEYSLGHEEIQQSISYVEARKKMMGGVSSISVIVDGVFFSDGAFIGEDQNFFFDSMNGQIQARRDLIKFLREAKSAGKNDTKILDEFLLNEPQTQPRDAESQARLGYVNSKDAFEQSYKSYKNILKEEVNGKRSKASDSFILNNFLLTQDSDFVVTHKQNE